MAKIGKAARSKKEAIEPPLVLGIESSCDETAVALVDGSGRVVAEQVASQIETHAAYGGVVPEVAARAHLDVLEPMARRVIEEAGIARGTIDAVAATTGPGLIGGLLVGASFAKAFAFAIRRPFIAINHLEAHALSVRLVAPVPFPYLLLLVSGGHCQTLVVEDVGRHRLIGTTIDDAVGEAFDKAAKLLGLGYPGGPAIERLAASGDPGRFSLPRPMVGRAEPDFSFSGLKTALATRIARISDEDGQRMP
ncbi:MAG: tRNA (adenosine(37)-N6)-threonylcarbamoyltransferase complex transferase subunit TsaD, partial [Alphaproteobacteria bacterium]